MNNAIGTESMINILPITAASGIVTGEAVSNPLYSGNGYIAVSLSELPSQVISVGEIPNFPDVSNALRSLVAGMGADGLLSIQDSGSQTELTATISIQSSSDGAVWAESGVSISAAAGSAVSSLFTEIDGFEKFMRAVVTPSDNSARYAVSVMMIGKS